MSVMVQCKYNGTDKGSSMMGHYITYDGTLHNIGDLIWLDQAYHMIHTNMMGHYITHITYDGTLHNIWGDIT